MEALIVSMIIAVLVVVLIGAICGVVALVNYSKLLSEFKSFQIKISKLGSRLERLEDKIGISPPGKPVVQAPALKDEPEPEPSAKPFPIPESSSPEPPLAFEEIAETPQAKQARPKYKVPSPAKTEKKSPQDTFEAIVGKRWMTWLGVAILFFSAAFFLKYAFDNNLIGPSTQVVICAILGIAVALAGNYFYAKNMTALGQGLIGLGMAVLYVTFTAASSSLYDPPVLEKTTAFIFMALVTIAGMSLAVIYNALPIAIIAVLGGLATPILVSTGVNTRDALFTYLLILNLGVLGAAAFRRWWSLDSIIITGTYLLYYGWFHKFYTQSQLRPALLWLGGFFLVYLILPFLYHLVHKLEVVVERFCFQLVNAIYVFSFAWYLLYRDHQSVLGYIALSLAAIYLLLGIIFRYRLPEDVRSIFSSIALAVAFVTISIPLHLKANGILLAWAIEGPVLLYLGYCFTYKPVRFFAALIMVLTIFRLCLYHWPEHQAAYIAFNNKEFITAIMIPLAMGVFALIHHLCRAKATPMDRVIKLGFAFGSEILALCLMHHDLYSWVKTCVEEAFASVQNGVSQKRMPPRYHKFIADCSVTGLWMLGSFGYLFAGRRARLMESWLVGLITLIAAGLLCSQVMGYKMGAPQTLFLNLRFATGLAFVLTLFIHAIVIQKTAIPKAAQRQTLRKVLYGGGIFFLLVLLSLEVPPYVAYKLKSANPKMVEQMSMTVVWGLYAVGLLIIGFWRNLAALRHVGLVLLGVAALKLLFVDMSKVKDILRVISFVVVGVLMIATSYLYHKFGKILIATVEKSTKPGEEDPQNNE
ncbi:MAG: DUF2339 domain-containing protein [Planctomycetes bacterium]|nr:DUF2339 domain-containing protein [Planctomycetota bacterium]